MLLSIDLPVEEDNELDLWDIKLGLDLGLLESSELLLSIKLDVELWLPELLELAPEELRASESTL